MPGNLKLALAASREILLTWSLDKTRKADVCFLKRQTQPPGKSIIYLRWPYQHLLRRQEIAERLQRVNMVAYDLYDNKDQE
jgi:hypothetical protein